MPGAPVTVGKAPMLPPFTGGKAPMLLPSEPPQVPIPGRTPTSTFGLANPSGYYNKPPDAGDYIVQPGNILSQIAARFGVSVAELAAANNIPDPNKILAGAGITIPGRDVSGVKALPAYPGAVKGLGTATTGGGAGGGGQWVNRSDPDSGIDPRYPGEWGKKPGPGYVLVEIPGIGWRWIDPAQGLGGAHFSPEGVYSPWWQDRGFRSEADALSGWSPEQIYGMGFENSERLFEAMLGGAQPSYGGGGYGYGGGGGGGGGYAPAPGYGYPPDYGYPLPPAPVNTAQQEYERTLQAVLPLLSPADQQVVAQTLYATNQAAYPQFAPGAFTPPPLASTSEAYYNQAQAQKYLDALRAMGSNSPAMAWLQQIAQNAATYWPQAGAVGSQAALGYSQALDPLLAQGQSSQYSPYLPLAKMISAPTLPPGVTPPFTLRQLPDGRYVVQSANPVY